ncbi:MAG: hypothetical protein IT350_14110 [Deltaproteobacteria bacterium]|nr:hypothetical protein [Deltaproteobacteria bacterium]
MTIRILLAMVCVTIAACGGGGDSDSSDGDAANDDDASADDDVSGDDTADDDTADDDTADDDTDDDSDDDADDDAADDDSADDDIDDDADDDSDDDADDDTYETTTVSGRAFRFDPSFDHLAAGEVEVVERPDLPVVVTDADGYFSMDGLYVGEDASFVIRHPDFWPTQTPTVVPDVDGIDDLTFQVPPRIIVRLLSLVLWEALDPDRCQIAVTATPDGGDPFTPGLEGVQVSIDPPLPAANGPFYFQIIEIPGWPMIDIPVRDLTETTHDGGAVFVNVPPGEYTITGAMPGETFNTQRLKCRAGMLVNAAPPYGLSPID